MYAYIYIYIYIPVVCTYILGVKNMFIHCRLPVWRLNCHWQGASKKRIGRWWWFLNRVPQKARKPWNRMALGRWQEPITFTCSRTLESRKGHLSISFGFVQILDCNGFRALHGTTTCSSRDVMEIWETTRCKPYRLSKRHLFPIPKASCRSGNAPSENCSRRFV